MDNLIDRIKDNWLEWKSLPYAFVILVMAFLAFAGLPNLLSDAIGYLYLGLIFAGIFIIYVLFCAIHVSRMKKAGAAASNEAFEMGHKNKLSAWMAVVIGCVVLAVTIFLIVFAANKDDRDGKYVIWADNYHIALTPEVHKDYYLLGTRISVLGEKLNDYPKQCVFELDFEKDDTFTIKYNDKLLGVQPGQNGIGYADFCTSTSWKLKEVQDSVYYIINSDENVYLKWYDDMQNWTTHPDIIEGYEDQYLLCLEKVD